MKEQLDEDLFVNEATPEEAEEEDDDSEEFGTSKAFLRGYNEEPEDPYEEKRAEEEPDYP